MNFNRVMGLILIVGGSAFGLATALRGQTQTGDWTIHRSDEPGKVEVSIMDSRGGHHFHSSSDWEVKELTGLDLSKPGRQDVHFTITRDAGRFDCEGYVKDGEGAGLFHFIPDAKYVQEMKALGFGGIDGDKQWAMAIHDVSLKFAREIKSKNLQGLDTDKLIAFNRILSTRAVHFTVALDTTRAVNEITMFADNLGSIPPNTALMVVTDGKKRYEIPMASNLDKNATLKIRRKKK